LMKSIPCPTSNLKISKPKKKSSSKNDYMVRGPRVDRISHSAPEMISVTRSTMTGRTQTVKSQMFRRDL
jgi:hypothetical protein